MTAYLLRRLAQVLPTALLAATLVFALVHLVPGDPVEMMLGEGARAADVESLRRDLGLDRPLLEQYASFLGGLARGDLGRSLHSGEPVLATLAERFPATLELAVASLIVALLVALPLGVVAALYRDRVPDHLARLLALLGVSMPSFWLALTLILLFAVQLQWLPPSGLGDSPWSLDGVRHMVLPVLVLALGSAGSLARYTRSAMLEVINRDYVRTARAKGLPAAAVYLRHVWPNAAPPVLALAGLHLGSLVGGAVVVETIFAWPGLGRLAVTSILARDFPTTHGVILTLAAGFIAANLLADLAHHALDPRLRAP